MDKLDIEEVKERLCDFTYLENDEFTEVCDAMCNFHDKIHYIDNENLRQSLEKEIRYSLEHYEDNYKIVEKEVTRTSYVQVLEEI